jgi:hypothetical protein
MGNGAMAKGPQATAPILDSTETEGPRLSRLGLCLIGEPRQQLLDLTRIAAPTDPLVVR